MYSEDRTIEIAKKFNCKIVYHQKTGIVEPARNWAMDQAAGEWILVLDADEMVTPELWQELKSYAADPIPGYYACALTRETVIMGKVLRSWRQNKCKRFSAQNRKIPI